MEENIANSTYDPNDITPEGTYETELTAFNSLVLKNNGEPIKTTAILFDKEHIRAILDHKGTELVKVLLGLDSDNVVHVYISGVLKLPVIGPDSPGVAHAP
ncbi:MAG: hypothetical protein QG594_1363 [Bacteroidota bacterium]|nr:hypothetical protein [Bacteroidota bacterium]